MIRTRVSAALHRGRALAAAIETLRAGGVVAYPTDTLYGLAVDPRSEVAVERLFDVKGRDRTQAIPLIAANVEQAQRAGRFGRDELRLAAAFWPGPLAIVVRADEALAGNVVAGDGTVAIRVPAHELARALADEFGFCLTATSANLSGQPPTASPDVVAVTLRDRVDLLLDGGDAPGGAPSTIVAIRHDGPTLVRAGAIAWQRVLESLN